MTTTPHEPAGSPLNDLNHTQLLYARTLGRQRMDMLDHHVHQRSLFDAHFNARVKATAMSLLGSFPQGLLQASEEFVAVALHVDDVMTGRWETSDMEARMSGKANLA